MKCPSALVSSQEKHGSGDKHILFGTGRDSSEHTVIQSVSGNTVAHTPEEPEVLGERTASMIQEG